MTPRNILIAALFALVMAASAQASSVKPENEEAYIDRVNDIAKDGGKLFRLNGDNERLFGHHDRDDRGNGGTNGDHKPKTTSAPVTNAVTVPEPESLLLLATGLIGAGFWRRRRR